MKAKHPCFLVVDESDDDHFMIHRALRDVWEHTIRQVSGSSEAIAYLNGNGEFSDRVQFPYPTTILTDLRKANGFELLKNLKQNPQFAVIPTIVFSGSTDPDDIKQVYALGASCYLIKPFSPVEMKSMMGKLVAFWELCEVPEIDLSGRMLETRSDGNRRASEEMARRR